MSYGAVTVVEGLSELALSTAQPEIYDREVGIRLLHRDERSGAEHYLIRYPAGLQSRPHRHTAAHTMVVLEGLLAVNDTVVGPFAYCHFPAGERMHHAPADDGQCLFVIVFDGPFDVQLADD